MFRARFLSLSALSALVLIGSLVGCKDEPPPVVEAPVEAPPPEPEPLQFMVTAEVADGGTQPIPTDVPEAPVIDSMIGLSLSTNLGLSNHRVRVFDSADRVVPSDDETEAPPPGGGILYRVRFLEPLKPGSRYTLVIDAETGDVMTDSEGREQSEFRYEFQIADPESDAGTP
jgi:hypothetical protein